VAREDQLMRIALFSTRPYERAPVEERNRAHGFALTFFEHRLNAETAGLAAGHACVCAFVNDDLGAPVLARLSAGGTRLIALRSAGYNHVDLKAAAKLGLTVVRVPAYSPYAVAEHAVALILTLNRKTHRAYNRVREGNFSLDGLLGFDLHGKTVGVVGTGKIGLVFAGIMRGFGCRVLACDPYPSGPLEYVPLNHLLAESHIVSLHCPLTPETRHLIHHDAIALMKPGVMLINTSRGALVDAQAAIAGLKSGRLGALGLDVYEEEADLFFEDLSNEVLQDDIFARLLTFPNVVITGHQAFFTREALDNIIGTTLDNVSAFAAGCPVNTVAAA
jgi:D-lactate dehydrogenase